MRFCQAGNLCGHLAAQILLRQNRHEITNLMGETRSEAKILDLNWSTPLPNDRVKISKGSEKGLSLDCPSQFGRSEILMISC
jgi:hypothetical protein